MKLALTFILLLVVNNYCAQNKKLYGTWVEYKREVVGATNTSLYTFKNSLLPTDLAYVFIKDSFCMRLDEDMEIYRLKSDTLCFYDYDVSWPERVPILTECFLICDYKEGSNQLVLEEIGDSSHLACRHFFKKEKNYSRKQDSLDDFFVSRDAVASFKGGQDTMLLFILEKQGFKFKGKYPEHEMISIKIYVDEKGKIVHAENRSLPPSKSSSIKAMRIVEQMPDWIPPEVNLVIDFEKKIYKPMKIKSVQTIEIPIIIE